MQNSSDLLRNALVDVAAGIDALFDRLLAVPQDPRARLYEAMRHAAIGGGKRLRPLLVCAAADLFHVDRQLSLRVGAAVEAMHVYSLIHDDLPCMDDDDDPFVRSELVRELALAAGPAGMAGGQMMDLMAETSNFDLPTVTRLQQLKTGALIGFSVEAGAILARIPAEGRRPLRGYARDIGLAFQIADDIMDVEGDEALAGKALHKDADAGKATFVTLMGIDRAREQAGLLVDQAIAHLAGFGEEAALLRAIARFVVERDR